MAGVDLRAEQSLDERTGDVAAHLAVVIVATAHRNFRAELVGRCARDEIHRTGEGAATKERRLRAADHLDPLEVVEAVAADRARHEDAVDEEGGIRLALDVRHAADDRPVTDAAEGRAEGKSSGIARHVANVEHAALLDLLLGDGRDRKRHLLLRFANAAGGHRDLVEFGSVAFLGRSLLLLRERGRALDQRDGDGDC